MTTKRPGRRGRRPGSPDTRTAILDAARECFAFGGFGGTTVRAVASAAGVDAALVHHYFGSKDDLFFAALELPFDPREVLAEAARSGGAEGAGERLVRTFLGVWDDPASRPALVALARRGLEPGGEPLLRDGFIPMVVVPLGEQLGVDRPEVRMPLVASQILGLIVMRYLLEVEPVASMGAEAVVATYGPVVQRYLTGPLPS